MESASSFNRCQIAVYIILASIYLKNTSESSSVTWSKYNVLKSTDAIDQSIVTQTYPGAESSLQCALVCTHVASESFYHLQDSSVCYCNNQTDGGIVADETGTVIYGYPVQPGTAAECQGIYDMGLRTDGEFMTSTGRKILCDLTSLGWTVFQRRVDGSVEFQRNWDAYVAGFGDTNGEFWLGLEELHQLTLAGCELHVYLEAEPDHPVQAKGYARYNNFSVGDVVSNYRLSVDGFSGNADDSLAYHNGQQFSTYDADHDVSSNLHCALTRVGGWWYNGINNVCHHSNLNSAYHGGYFQSVSGIRWGPWGYAYSLFRTEMAYRC